MGHREGYDEWFRVFVFPFSDVYKHGTTLPTVQLFAWYNSSHRLHWLQVPAACWYIVHMAAEQTQAKDHASLPSNPLAL